MVYLAVKGKGAQHSLLPYIVHPRDDSDLVARMNDVAKTGPYRGVGHA